MGNKYTGAKTIWPDTWKVQKEELTVNPKSADDNLVKKIEEPLAARELVPGSGLHIPDNSFLLRKCHVKDFQTKGEEVHNPAGKNLALTANANTGLPATKSGTSQGHTKFHTRKLCTEGLSSNLGTGGSGTARIGQGTGTPELQSSILALQEIH
ncbi:hypothetical protein HAX54_014393 [Datura stramonium]|uniref:Uncharacterized protein n=1 Tax=Datura stramonium TaxID=4076 RepID=A0ABS8TN46_DATST|nr:hypothetical protein [Datura stramonium]